MKLYSIYDTKVQAFCNPIVCRNDGEAIRAFTGACNGGDKMLTEHYLDQVLFTIGSWDVDTGKINPDCTAVIKGLEVKNLEAKSA